VESIWYGKTGRAFFCPEDSVEQTDISFRQKYYKFVICGYIALAALMLFVLRIPTSWRIGMLIVAAILVSIPMYMGRASVAGSHTDYDTDGIAAGDKE
jgi:hypothetical protein